MASVPAAGIATSRETRMANGDREAKKRRRPTRGPSAGRKNRNGEDVPAGGFVQLLTPDGERIESVTTADGMTYSVDFTDAEYRQLYEDLVTVRRLDGDARLDTDRTTRCRLHRHAHRRTLLPRSERYSL
jgi:hypothetical protein